MLAYLFATALWTAASSASLQLTDATPTNAIVLHHPTTDVKSSTLLIAWPNSASARHQCLMLFEQHLIHPATILPSAYHQHCLNVIAVLLPWNLAAGTDTVGWLRQGQGWPISLAAPCSQWGQTLWVDWDKAGPYHWQLPAVSGDRHCGLTETRPAHITGSFLQSVGTDTVGWLRQGQGWPISLAASCSQWGQTLWVDWDKAGPYHWQLPAVSGDRHCGLTETRPAHITGSFLQSVGTDTVGWLRQGRPISLAASCSQWGQTLWVDWDKAGPYHWQLPAVSGDRHCGLTETRPAHITGSFLQSVGTDTVGWLRQGRPISLAAPCSQWGQTLWVDWDKAKAGPYHSQTSCLSTMIFRRNTA